MPIINHATADNIEIDIDPYGIDVRYPDDSGDYYDLSQVPETSRELRALHLFAAVLNGASAGVVEFEPNGDFAAFLGGDVEVTLWGLTRIGLIRSGWEWQKIVNPSRRLLRLVLTDAGVDLVNQIKPQGASEVSGCDDPFITGLPPVQVRLS